jgi:hypothetical protein
MMRELKPLERRPCKICKRYFVILAPFNSRALTCSKECSKILRKERNHNPFREHYRKRPQKTAIRDSRGRFTSWEVEGEEPFV